MTNWIGVPELFETFDRADTLDFEAERQAHSISFWPLADERVFSDVIPNKDRVNYTTGIVMKFAFIPTD